MYNIDEFQDSTKPLKIWCNTCRDWHYVDEDSKQLNLLSSLGCDLKWKSLQTNKGGENVNTSSNN